MKNIKENIGVTIGITSFNAQETIANAISCALNQSWLNKEIIIIDDGSSDNSQNIIEKKIKNKEINFIKNKINRGASFSRNLIIENSKTNIICFMDDDDYSDFDRVKKQVQEIIKSGYPEEKFIACSTGINKTYRNGYSKDYLPMGSKGRLPKGKELADYLLFYEKVKGVDYGFCLPTCSLMITKDCFKKYGDFDLNLIRVEDMDLSIRLSFGNVKFITVKEILVKQNSNTFSNTLSFKNFKSEITLIKKYKKYLISKDLYRHSLLWPELRFNYFNFNYIKCSINIIELFFRNPIRTFRHIIITSFKRLLHDIKNGSLSLKRILNF